MNEVYLPRFKVVRWPNNSPYLLRGYLARMPDDNQRIMYKPIDKDIRQEWLTTQLINEWHETPEQAIEHEIAKIKHESDDRLTAIVKQVEGLLRQ